MDGAYYLIPFRTESRDRAYEGAHEECLHLFTNEHQAERRNTPPISCIHCGGCGGIVAKPFLCFFHGHKCPNIDNTFEPRVPF